jgi:hypothetical protein
MYIMVPMIDCIYCNATKYIVGHLVTPCGLMLHNSLYFLHGVE